MDILKEFKVLLLDADGVFFSGSEFRGTLPSGESIVFKERDYRDGQGLSFLRALGIKIVFVSGEGEPLQSIVTKINALPSVASGDWKPVEVFTGKNSTGGKVASIEAWLTENDFSWSDCVYMGDDRNDLEGMKLAGLAVCPADAQRLIRSIADLTLTKRGGQGALREFSELVLDARGVDETTLSPA